MSSRANRKTIELSLKELLNKTNEQLVQIFKINDISIQFEDKRVDIYYCPGTRFGIDFCELISLAYLVKAEKPYTETDKEEYWRYIFNKPLSPLDLNKVMIELKKIITNIKEKKRVNIRNLTQKEIKDIIYEQNKPLAN